MFSPPLKSTVAPQLYSNSLTLPSQRTPRLPLWSMRAFRHPSMASSPAWADESNNGGCPIFRRAQSSLSGDGFDFRRQSSMPTCSSLSYEYTLKSNLELSASKEDARTEYALLKLPMRGFKVKVIVYGKPVCDGRVAKRRPVEIPPDLFRRP